MIYILLFPIEFDRTDVEKIENRTFETGADLLKEIQQLQYNDEIKITSLDDIKVYELTDYMDACNNEEVDTDGTWITYVNLKSFK
ncbi:MAG: hypothetical protein ACRDD8_09625 [Bacteroidales bacterium]